MQILTTTKKENKTNKKKKSYIVCINENLKKTDEK